MWPCGAAAGLPTDIRWALAVTPAVDLICSLGLGAMDMIIANQIYKNAKKMGIGQKLMLWDAPKWV